MTYSYLDSWSNISQVVSIVLDSIQSKYHQKSHFAWSKDTIIHIEIQWTTVVSGFNQVFISGNMEQHLLSWYILLHLARYYSVIQNQY